MVLQFISDDLIILLGENSLENDMLCKRSSQTDLWFHIENDSSSHVILKLSGSGRPPKKRKNINNHIYDACLLCKMYSKFKHNNKSTVIYTEIKNIKKDKSCKSGEVILKKSPNKKVIKNDDISLLRLKNTIIKLNLKEIKQ